MFEAAVKIFLPSTSPAELAHVVTAATKRPDSATRRALRARFALVDLDLLGRAWDGSASTYRKRGKGQII